MSRKKDETVITSAAYLLFYRRQSATPLGGPFFEQIMAGSSDSPSASSPNSRGPSPSPVVGEGRRLDGSFRNGSSSASREVGAGHQTGGGGLAGQAAKKTTNDDEELPPYSTVDLKDMSHAQTLEGMDVDEDEAIGMGGESRSRTMGYGEAVWSFNQLNEHEDEHLGTRVVHLPPPNSDAEDDKDSVKVGSDVSNQENRMADFADDEGTTMDVFGTPPRDRLPVMESPWGQPGYEDDGEVVEVRISPPTEEEEAEKELAKAE